MAEGSSQNYISLNKGEAEDLNIRTVCEMEQKNVSTGGVSSPIPIFDNTTNHNGSTSTSPNRKRIRRKNRNKKKIPMENALSTDVLTESVVDMPDSDLLLSNLLNEMRIIADTNQMTGSALRIKHKFYKCSKPKFFKHLNESYLGNSTTSHCTCDCHNKEQSNDASTSGDNEKSDVASADTFNGSPQTNLSLANDVNLQSENVSKILQNASSSKSPTKKRVRQRRGFFEKKYSLSEITTGLNSGILIQGTIRINAKNFHEAYVSNINDEENDYFISNIADRNRALDSDVVIIKLKPKEEWTERLKTASVVHILQHVHPRTAVGFLHPCTDHNAKVALFIPRDLRIPKMRIPIKACPQGFFRHSHRFENILFKGKIIDWNNVTFATGVIIEGLGFAGDLESETCAILADYGLDITPFKPDDMELLKLSDSIPKEEFRYREDLRNECIFTIDPMTARDLDDAVSCKELNNGNFEIGVHISDVSFYIQENSLLDKKVRNKATTIYMVNNVYHMLPQELCLHCSLLPGKDKLAFSVFWEMTKSGEIIKQRFCRTIINSCVQLSYEHAQAMIENPNHTFKKEELPRIHGRFTQRDLSRIVNNLQTIAVILRNKRFEKGSLRIDQTKLLFRIDESTGEPIDFFVYENKEAHRLIEEFMLLANISVAIKIANTYPDKAFLRCHDPPKMHMLVELQKTLKQFNIDIDISSSKALQASLLALGGKLGEAQMGVLNHLLAKPMMRARYFSSGDTKNEDFCHYALCVLVYTHFTSPIRRYADIMVHKLLAASLNYTEEPQWNSRYVTSIANQCNKQKYLAKCAGEASSDLYLAYYISEHEPFVVNAVVIDVKQSSFEILVHLTGSVIKIFTNALGKGIGCTADEHDNKKLLIVFEQTPDLPEIKLLIGLFSVITVALHRKPKTIKLEATLERPVASQVYTKRAPNHE